jgi:phage I-like protein
MADKPKYAVELEQKVVVHDVQIGVVKELAEATRSRLDATKSEYDKDVAALKTEVAELKADKKAREGHDGEIKTLRSEVNTLKDDVKYWRNAAVGLGTATILLLIGLLFKK